MARGAIVFYLTEGDPNLPAGNGSTIPAIAYETLDLSTSQPLDLVISKADGRVWQKDYTNTAWNLISSPENDRLKGVQVNPAAILTADEIIPNRTPIRRAHLQDMASMIKALQLISANRYGDKYFNIHYMTDATLLWRGSADITLYKDGNAGLRLNLGGDTYKFEIGKSTATNFFEISTGLMRVFVPSQFDMIITTKAQIHSDVVGTCIIGPSDAGDPGQIVLPIVTSYIHNSGNHAMEVNQPDLNVAPKTCPGLNADYIDGMHAYELVQKGAIKVAQPHDYDYDLTHGNILNAQADKLGVVQIGNGIDIDANGILSIGSFLNRDQEDGYVMLPGGIIFQWCYARLNYDHCLELDDNNILRYQERGIYDTLVYDPLAPEGATNRKLANKEPVQNNANQPRIKFPLKFPNACLSVIPSTGRLRAFSGVTSTVQLLEKPLMFRGKKIPLEDLTAAMSEKSAAFDKVGVELFITCPVPNGWFTSNRSLIHIFAIGC